MSGWVPAAVGAMAFVGVHYLFLRAASGRIADSLGALILESAAAIGIALSFTFVPRGEPVATTRSGVVFAVASGLAVSFASVLMFATLRKGGPVASTGTIVLGGGVTLSALFAPLFFGEAFTPRRALGVALGVAAIAVLSSER